MRWRPYEVIDGIKVVLMTEPFFLSLVRSAAVFSLLFGLHTGTQCTPARSIRVAATRAQNRARNSLEARLCLIQGPGAVINDVGVVGHT